MSQPLEQFQVSGDLVVKHLVAQIADLHRMLALERARCETMELELSALKGSTPRSLPQK